jgi:hypothetical protein
MYGISSLSVGSTANAYADITYRERLNNEFCAVSMVGGRGIWSGIMAAVILLLM